MARYVSRMLVTAVVIGLVFSVGSTTSLAGKESKAKGAKEMTENMPIFPLAKKAGFNTLAKAIQVAGLQQTLTAEGPFTVFAPTDEAFAKLPEGTLDALLKDPDSLKNVLLYHVVEGKVLAADVVKLESATTLLGEPISIDTSSGVKVNDANVIQTDVLAKNGVIHVIDAVLVP